MKIKKIANARSLALLALGVFLGHGAQADTILDFESLPTAAGQNQNAAIIQSFGDNASASSEGVTVVGFGTPNIGLTWQATPVSGGAARWDFYIDDIWAAGQLDSSSVGDRHEVVFTPNNPQAAAVIQSFNFHPYYLSTERYTYDVSVLAGETVVSGPSNITFIAESTKVAVNFNYTGAAGQALTLRITRVASTLGEGEIEGGAANIAVDDITFAQLPETELSVGPQVIAVTPANNQISVAPDGLYRASITNLTTAVVTSTIQLRLNGNPVSPAPGISQADDLTTVSYLSPAVLPSASTNRYTLTYADNGAPAKSYTNEVQFIVAAYVDLQLPPPIVFEDFDSTPEGSLPAGWTAVSLDTLRNQSVVSEPALNFGNLDSDAYTNWTTVDVSRFTGTFDTYSQLYSGLTQPAGYAEDYQRVLSVNPSNVVNGVFLRNLASGRMAFANSGYRNDDLGQVMYLFSPDFNLTGKTDVHLAFHSIWEQNQDSLATVEYSIDSGTNWLPVVYMLVTSDVYTNLDGSIDAATTFSTIHPAGFEGVATYYNPETGIEGGYYGAFIGVDSSQWSTLGDFISRRADDNPVASKRVELFRLPQADNQPKVRLRFAHAGTDSWYFGIDDVGFYSLATAQLQINSIVREGTVVTIAWDGAPGTKLQKATSLTNPNWQDVPGSDGASSVNEATSDPAAFYRLVRPN
jgi:hypothetical protein